MEKLFFHDVMFVLCERLDHGHNFGNALSIVVGELTVAAPKRILEADS